MTVYAIAMFSIRDPAAYERYQARFVGVMNRYKGQLLAADKHPVVVEGSWDLEKVVLLSFPSDADFREFANSNSSIASRCFARRFLRTYCSFSLVLIAPEPMSASLWSISSNAALASSYSVRNC